MGQEVGNGAAPVAFHQLYNEVCDKLNLFKSEPPSLAKLSGKIKEIKESIEKYKVAYGIEEHADHFIPPFIFEELLEDLRGCSLPTEPKSGVNPQEVWKKPIESLKRV